MGVIPIPTRFLYFTIKDPSAAQNVIGHLVRSSRDSIILPFCDYPGPIIKEVLSKQFRGLVVCEPDNATRIDFKKYLGQNYPDKNVFTRSDNLFELLYKTHSHEAQQRCSDIVAQTTLSGDTAVNSLQQCGNNIKMLVPLLKSRHESAFLRNIYYQVCLKLGLCSNHLVHYYFLMSDRQHTYLKAKPKENMRLYRSSSVLYNTIFNVRTLESFDLKKCFGINVKSIQNTTVNNAKSYKKVHLVWLEPKLEVLDSLNPRSLIEYRFLVTQMMHRRTGLVVAFLDRFFDKYKDKIALIGIDENARSGDLSTEQFYNLYMLLKALPSYNNSTFLHAVARSEENILSLQD